MVVLTGAGLMRTSEPLMVSALPSPAAAITAGQSPYGLARRREFRHHSESKAKFDSPRSKHGHRGDSGSKLKHTTAK